MNKGPFCLPDFLIKSISLSGFLLVLPGLGCPSIPIQKEDPGSPPPAGKTATSNRVPDLRLAGEGFFPLGWYSGLDASNLRVMKAAGMNTVVPYSGDKPDAEVERFMDAAAKEGMHVLVEISRKEVLAINAGGKDFSVILSRIRNLMGKKNLLGWYLIDEPHLQAEIGIPPSVCKTIYDSIKAVDPNHPVFIVDTQWGWTGQWDSDRSKSYAIACDVAMWDEYPLMDTMAAMPSRLFRVAETSHLAKEVVSREERSIPLVGVLQAYGYRNKARRENFPVGDVNRRRDPSYEELRYMTYSSVIHGSRGLFFWVYYRADSLVEDRVHRVVKELHANRIPDLVLQEDLGGLVVAESHSDDSDRNGLRDVNLFFRQLDGSYYMIASNDSPRALANVRFAIDTSVAIRSVLRIDPGEKQKQVTFAQNTFEDDFTRFQIHFYRLEPR